MYRCRCILIYAIYAYIWKDGEEKVEEDRKVNEAIYMQ